MKKLLGILVLGLLFNTNVFAKIVTLEKCYENTYKQEFIQTIKGIPEDPSIREYGPNDESWSKKSYEDYMNNIIVASEKNKKTFDPFAEKKTKKLKKKDEFKITINTKTGILSFITLSSPNIKKTNLKVTDYMDGVFFAEEKWDESFGNGNGRFGYNKYQVNIIKGTLYYFEFDTRYLNDGTSQNYQNTNIYICQPNNKLSGKLIDKSDGNSTLRSILKMLK
jgi:hypothetical protein